MEYAYALDFRIIREGDGSTISSSIIERVAITDLEAIVKKGRDGVIISMMATPEFKSINIIIENPESAKGVITGSLEIPFPDEGETSIQTINGVIALQLLKIQNKNISALSFSDGSKKHIPTKGTAAISYANKAGNLNTNGNQYKPNADFKIVQRGINIKMSELLKSTIFNNKSIINTSTCYAYNGKNNCIKFASTLNTGEYNICSQCKGVLAQLEEFKCNKLNCTNSVFIDGKGNPKNEFCNECAK
uniref:Uncharacterized protein n=1 Tax=viral metagenome TaxID=1070528 RepID=A0A6C0I0T3_9ZZZZ